MRGVYTICQQLRNRHGLCPVAQMLLLSCDPTVNTPCQKWPGVFFVLVAPIGQGLSAIQQRKTLNGANPFPPTSMGTAGGSRTPDNPYLVSEAAAATTGSISSPHTCWYTVPLSGLFMSRGVSATVAIIYLV